LLLGQSPSPGENAAPTHGRFQHARAPRECVDGRGRALAFEEKDDFAFAHEHVVSPESQLLEIEGWPLLDQSPSRLGRTTSNRDNHGHARTRGVFGAEPSEQICDLAEQTHSAQSGDKDTLAGGPLEHERLVAVEPFAGAAADLDRRELVKRNTQPLRSTRPAQNEFVLTEFEPAARGRAIASTPHDRVVVRARASALGKQTCSSPSV
jgi:hypothetical protein